MPERIGGAVFSCVARTRARASSDRIGPHGSKDPYRPFRLDFRAAEVSAKEMKRTGLRPFDDLTAPEDRRAPRMRSWAYLALTGGVAAVVALVIYHGADKIAAAFAAAGWGLALVALWRIVPMATDTLGWQFLFEPSSRPPYLRLLWARWIGDSVNRLLPVLQVGGEVVKTRLLMCHSSVSGRMAGASVVVSLTLGVFTQLLFTLFGATLLVRLYGNTQLALIAAGGVVLVVGLLGAFYLAQRRGLFTWLVRAVRRLAAGRQWITLAGGASALDLAISELYRRRRALLANGFWQFLGWILGTGEVWLALYFMGSPVSLLDAMILESLAQGLRGTSFLVPGALGIQEGGLVLVGAVLGIGPDVALALSLAKRVRELAVGLPGLLAWQVFEGGRVFRRREIWGTNGGTANPVSAPGDEGEIS